LVKSGQFFFLQLKGRNALPVIFKASRVSMRHTSSVLFRSFAIFAALKSAGG
jgi:hypothetical protein